VDEILARAGIFHAVEPDVASALTIRMHKVDFPANRHDDKAAHNRKTLFAIAQKVPAHTNVSDAFCITVRIVLPHHETISNPTSDQRGCSSAATIPSPVGMNLG
jgi:hypothetical protein